ncbi:hypothetical protein AMTRI_Chr12g236650 [Amborella trichopoda]
MNNRTPEDDIIIPDDSEEVVPLAIQRGIEGITAPTTQGELGEGLTPTLIVTSNSGQVIDPLDWRAPGALVMEQRLNHCSSGIRTMEIGCDILIATYQLFCHASFSELAMFPFFLKNLMKNLTNINVSWCIQGKDGSNNAMGYRGLRNRRPDLY